jgi:HlyD family secretion protein
MRKDCGVNTDQNKQTGAVRPALSTRKSKKGRNTTVAVILLLLIVACAWGSLAPRDKGGWLRSFWAGETEFDISKWHEVKRGPLTISLTRSGTIHHRDKVIIQSTLDGSSTVIWLIDEGSEVKSGDLLLEMDPTSFVQKKEAQDIVVIRSEAQLVSETENLVVVKNTAKTSVEDAKLAIMLAELDLKKYLGGKMKDYSEQDPDKDDEGEYPNLFHQAQGAITIAKEELERAKERVKWSTQLAQDGYLTRTELQADELAKKKAELGVSSAQSDLAVLTKYTYARKLAELKNGLLKAQRALKPAERKAAANIRQAEADVAATTSEHKRHLALQKKYGDQIKECKIYAPGDGQVVYATTTSRRRHYSTEELKKGSSVRERQELFHMPNADHKMMAVVKIPQACEPMLTDPRDASLLRLPATVTIAGAKKKKFAATLAEIDPLPHHDYNDAIKVFNSEVHINEVSPDLRPGYNCEVNIVIAQYDDVIAVPIQSVQMVAGKPTVYVKTSGDPEPRSVVAGMDNNRFMHIKSGLEAGEHVLLAPPFEETKAKPSGAKRGKPEAKPGAPAIRPATGRKRTSKPNSGGGRPRGSGAGGGRPKR